MRKFALVDGNNFYVSCERCFRPSLLNKPVVVLSNNDGCAVARSQEAKDIGIKMGQPWFQIKEFARSHGLIALSSNYALYADMSDRMMTVIGQYSPVQEIYSIDESFLDLTGFRCNLTEYGIEIRSRVLQWTGIPTCVGIGASKTLAKFANHVAKKNIGRPWAGVCDFTALSEQEQDSIMASVAVGEVWGVGRKIAARLEPMGITTALQLKRASQSLIRKAFSVVLERTVLELNGVACYDFEATSQPQKQIVCSRSFGHVIYALEDLAQAVTEFVSRAGERLRRQGLKANNIQVFIQTSPFRKQDKQYSRAVNVPLVSPTSDTLKLLDSAMLGLRAIYKHGFRYAKAGIMLHELQAEGLEQVELFENNASQRSKLMLAMDSVNERFGRGTLKVGSVEGRQAWHMTQDKKTPCYTTEWSSLPVAR